MKVLRKNKEGHYCDEFGNQVIKRKLFGTIFYVLGGKEIKIIPTKRLFFRQKYKVFYYFDTFPIF